VRWWLCAVVVLAGCGRRHFDPLVDGSAVGDVIDLDAATCAHTFCDDFARTTPVVGGWDNAVIGAGGMSSLLGDQLRVQLFNTGDSAFLEKSFPRTTTQVSVGFSVSYTSAAAGIAEVDLVQLEWQMPPTMPNICTRYGFYLVRNGSPGGQFDLQETYSGCGANVDTAIVNLDNTGPHDVKLVVTIGPPTTVRVDIDGTPMLPTMMAAHPASASTLKLRLGAGVSRDLGPAWDLRYDDVYVDVQ
jgi:hypothetical protein